MTVSKRESFLWSLLLFHFLPMKVNEWHLWLVTSVETYNHACADVHASACILTINPLALQRNESIHSIKHMQRWYSAQVRQKCLWLGMTATHVFMWEWLEDELLFNSVLIGKGVIALCFFFSLLFFVSQQLLTDVVVGSEWMTDSGFSGGGEKKQTKHTVFVWSLPLTTSPSPSLLGELVKTSPPSLLLYFQQLLCLHYSWLYCWPLCPCMFIGWRTIK